MSEFTFWYFAFTPFCLVLSSLLYDKHLQPPQCLKQPLHQAAHASINKCNETHLFAYSGIISLHGHNVMIVSLLKASTQTSYLQSCWSIIGQIQLFQQLLVYILAYT